MKIYCIIDWKSPQQVHFRIDRHFNAICQLCGVFSIIVNSFLNFQGLLSLIIKTFHLFPFVYHWKKFGYLVLLVKKETHWTQQNYELCSLTVQWGNHIVNNDINSPRNNETIFFVFLYYGARFEILHFHVNYRLSKPAVYFKWILFRPSKVSSPSAFQIIHFKEMMTFTFQLARTQSTNRVSCLYGHLTVFVSTAAVSYFF